MAACFACGREVAEGLSQCPFCGGTVLPWHPRSPLGGLARRGEILGGRYQVEDVLGSGSSGVVYGVLDLKERSRVALKVLHPELLGFDALNRLSREVRLVRELSCPHLVKVYHMEDLGGSLALKMEWVRGESLRAYLRRRGGLPPAEALRLARGLFLALDALHGLSIVHRDVKSANLLLSEEGSLKLGDFGLARDLRVQGTLTRTGAVLGTVGYMAPEVARGEGATTLSDLYSAGCVLFEMLTGELPYEGESLDSLVRQAQEPPRLGLLRRRRVPWWLRRVVERLLEKNPADRFPSAQAVLEALEARWAGFRIPGRLRRRSFTAAAGLLGLAAAGGLLLWADASLPPRPTFAGKTLTVYGPLGNRRFTKTFDRPIQAVRGGRFGPGGRPAVAVALAWNESPVSFDLVSPLTEEGRDQLLFLGRAGEVTGSRRLSLGRDFSGFADRLAIFLDAHRFAPGKPEQLVVYAHHHLWYPSLLLVIRREPSWGSEWRSEDTLDFPHAGYLGFPPRYADLDGDGWDEVVLTAVNNLLYRMEEVVVLPAREGAGGRPRRIQEPAATSANDSLMEPPLLYRGVDLYRYRFLYWGRGTGVDGIALASRGGTFTLRQGLRLFDEGGREVAPSPRETEALNQRIRRLFLLRQAGDYRRLLEEARAWPSGLPEPYDWLGVFFEAHALMGLGRPAEVRPLLEDFGARHPSPIPLPPYYATRLLLESAFLAGDYGGGLAAFRALPHEAAVLNLEAAQAAFWCAVYGGDEGAALDLAERRGGMTFGGWGPVLEALHLSLSGGAPAAEAAFGRLPLDRIQFPEALLYAAAFEAERGRQDRAEALLQNLHARFGGEALDGGETEAFVRFAGRPQSPPVVEMEAALARRRRAALLEPQERALLPLTLARTAAVFRAAGRAGEAAALEAEALARAPQAWKRYLSHLARRTGSAGPGGTDRGK